jgi:hypothetical protein
VDRDELPGGAQYLRAVTANLGVPRLMMVAEVIRR